MRPNQGQGNSHEIQRSAVGVSRETSARLQVFSDLLLRWTRTVNLIGPADQDSIQRRHVQDSLRLLPHLPVDAVDAVDLGSGAGLPGLILAIASNRHFTLVEADARKCAFLTEAARLTQAPVTVVNQRIEALDTLRTDLVTARALAPLPRLLALCHPLLRPGGTALFLKGATMADEVAQARTSWNFDAAFPAGESAEQGGILRITGLQPKG